MMQGEATGGGGPVVMLVEDFRDTREMMRRMLETQGCRVVEASNGQEAIELSQRGGLDLVLMDLNMPVLDGFNATLRIREYERTRDVPVVAVTAYDSAESRAAAAASTAAASPASSTHRRAPRGDFGNRTRIRHF